MQRDGASQVGVSQLPIQQPKDGVNQLLTQLLKDGDNRLPIQLLKDGASQVGEQPTRLLKDGVRPTTPMQVGAKAAKNQDSDKAPIKAGEAQVETAIRVGAIKAGDISERKADQ